MTQYKDEFRELSKYAPKGARLVVEMSCRFLRGLLPHYNKLVVGQNLCTTKELAKSAIVVECI